MRLSLPALALFAPVSAASLCPLLGPSWPAAVNLTRDATVSAALQNITTNLQAAVDAGNFSGDSLSIQIFDKNDSDALLKFFSTGQSINTTIGVSEVDENTVFRIGSTSKLFTVLLLLIKSEFHIFDERVSNYIPEIQRAEFELHWNATKRDNGIDFLKWNEVTVGELATHLAGLPRDYGILDLASQAPMLESLGFPVLSPEEIPPCGLSNPCTRRQFFTGLFQAHPVVSTASTPSYSNAAFAVLGYIVEALTRRKFENALREQIIYPLGLKNTFYTSPNTSLGVIPVPQGEYWWNLDFGNEGPAGGIFSSAKDLSTFGRAILDNTLLWPVNTRRWLKPRSHTSSLDYGVGAPWEIISFGDERPIDLYTKSGDVPLYSTGLALDPDHDAGFLVLAAGNNSHATVALGLDIIAATLLPALEQAAKSQADAHFSGTYTQTGSNSSITIATDDGPGLVVTAWTNNGIDMIESYATLHGFTDSSQFNIRLYPTGLTSPGQISFRAVTPTPLPPGIGPFSSSCVTWLTLDSSIYGNVGLDEFSFGVNDDGNALSISPRVLRTVLSKAST